jgi:hypothetical protein
MLVRQTILKLVLLFFALIWVVDADAVVYKWKDEKGKTHYTDDPTRVPEAFRNKPLIKGSSKYITSESTEKKLAVDESDVLGKKSDLEDDKKEEDMQEGLTDAQRSTVEAVVNFLKEDIPRYDKFYTYPPSRSKFRLIKQAVAGATPQKQSLLGQVSQNDLPLLDPIAGFLKISIAEDEKSQKVLPTTIVSTRQTQALMNRLKSEAEQEKQFLEKLTAALDDKK